MRFFTPDLYVRFNSPDDPEADEADAAWEAALAGYREHLDRLRDRMSPQVRKLAGLCLHDAELLACDQAVEPAFPFPFEPFGFPPLWSAMAVVSVKHEGQVTSLVYALWDRLREYPAAAGWPFSRARTHWLYDEVDLAPGPRPAFLHRILLSDGRVLEVPFLSAFVHTAPLTPPADGVRVRQSA